MRPQIDVLDSGGIRRGPLAPQNWQSTKRLSAAGDWRAAFTLTAPRTALLEQQVRVEGYGFFKDSAGTQTRVVLEAGVLHDHAVRVEGTAAHLEVGGADLLDELNTRLIGPLALYTDVGGVSPEAVYENQSTGSDDYAATARPTLHDGNAGTTVAMTLTPHASFPDFIYIGHPNRFYAAALTITVGNSFSDAVLRVQYWNGTDWVDLDIVADGTDNGSGTFKQSGTVEWLLPEDLHRGEFQTDDLFWVRLFPADVDEDDVPLNPIQATLGEITITERNARADDLQPILDFATGMGWSLAGAPYRPNTETGTYLTFSSDTTVLGALTRLAELKGEAFTWGLNEAGDKEIRWQWSGDSAASGLRAIRGTPNRRADLNPDVLLIENLEVRSDYRDVFHKVYPYGAGQEFARLSLAYLDPAEASALVGYTVGLDAVGTYLAVDPLPAGYIERELTYGDIGGSNDQAAAAMLLDAALADLQRHKAAPVFYNAQTVNVHAVPEPGTTLRLIYRGIATRHTRDGTTDTIFLDIDETLLIQEVSLGVGTDGVLRAGLTLASSDLKAKDDYAILASTVRAVRHQQAHSQPVSGRAILPVVRAI